MSRGREEEVKKRVLEGTPRTKGYLRGYSKT